MNTQPAPTGHSDSTCRILTEACWGPRQEGSPRIAKVAFQAVFKWVSSLEYHAVSVVGHWNPVPVVQWMELRERSEVRGGDLIPVKGEVGPSRVGEAHPQAVMRVPQGPKLPALREQWPSQSKESPALWLPSPMLCH